MSYASSAAEFLQIHADKLTVAAALVIFLGTWCYARWWATGTRVKLPPSPPGNWPIIGHLHLLGPAPHKSMAQLSHKYGPLMLLKLGSKPHVVVSSPAMAKEIFKHHDLTFSNRPHMTCMDQLDHMHQGFTFVSNNATWRKLRKIFTAELMSPKRRQHSQRIRAEETRSLLKSTLDVDPGAPIPIYSKVERMVVDVLSRILLSRRFESSGGIKIEELSSMSDEIQCAQESFHMGDYVPWLRWLDVNPKKDSEVRLQRILTVILNEHRAKRRQPSHVDEDMLDALLSHHEKEGEDSISEENARSILWDAFQAGTETTASITEWAMAHLVQEPRTLEKLRTEIDNEVGLQRLVTEGDIPRLKYLQAVVKEAFRLHPPAPLGLPHYSQEPCTVAGYHIPAFTTVYLNSWAVGRDPGIWERPLEFSPERFLEEPFSRIDPASGQSFELLPFGSGRRMCPGSAFGVVTPQLVLASIVQGFHLSVSHEVDMADTEARLVMRMATPLQLHMRPRLPLAFY